MPLKLIDTAGIRDTNDQVEKIGVERSRKALGAADLVLLLIDSSNELTQMEAQLAKLKELWKQADTVRKKDKIHKQIKEVQKQIDKLNKEVEAKAAKLTSLRKKGAEIFSKRIEEKLHRLGMEAAVFRIAITPLSLPGPYGKDK